MSSLSLTPRSRKNSVRGQLKSSPSRLVIPPLRPSPSLSNIRIHSRKHAPYTEPPSPTLTAYNSSNTQNQALDSSASSLDNMDFNEGILVHDVDAEVDTVDGVEGIASGEINAPVMDDEQSKNLLKDKLRKTLSNRLPGPDDVNALRSRNDRQPDTDFINHDIHPQYRPREYFILTDAGKPVFTSRNEEEVDTTTTTIGIMQALISVFIDDGDKLRCINAGNTRITFLIRSPLYYVCSSSWGEPESVIRSHLEYLHLQILSIVTGAQLRKIFERRTNFDLRRLLNGAESFLTSLLTRLEFDLGMSTSSLQCLKLEPGLRKRAADALLPPSKSKDILYVVLIARGRVISLIRPRKHSIHPADIHILLNTIHSPSILNSPASAVWIPICLPKFNPSGFVNGYISFLRKDDGLEAEASAAKDDPGNNGEASSGPPPVEPRRFGHELDSGIALVCISGSGEFETIRGWCDQVTKRLESEGTLDGIANAFRSGSTEYSVSELGIPGLRHFIYKSRGQVQVTVPMFDDLYQDITERRRLIILYQIIHDAIHAKSGQLETLKLQYIKTEKESVLGWITQPFELYVTLSPWLPKTAAVGAANSVVRWVKKEEARLFLKDAPVF